MKIDERFMLEAISEAEKAEKNGDVPIGAIVVKDDKIIGRGFNQVEKLKNPTKHAEIIAISEACKNIGYSRLYDATLYVTCEPCTMCAGGILLSRVKRVVIGTCDYKTGACGSVYNFLQENKLNHEVDIIKGVLQEECSFILSNFFRKVREEKRRKK